MRDVPGSALDGVATGVGFCWGVAVTLVLVLLSVVGVPAFFLPVVADVLEGRRLGS